MKKWLKRIKKDERGLTLVELLAVVVILAIVAAIAFISIGNVIENSKKDAHISNAQQIISAAKLYEASGGDLNGENFKFSDIDTIGELVDPWTKKKYSGDDYASVTRASNSEEYKVTLTAGEDKCSISDKSEEELRNEDRDTLCDIEG